MAISKLPMPRLNELVTHGRVIVDCGEEDDKDAPVSAWRVFVKGGVFGLI
jgi:CNT family concentrative nucleoside transporter